MKRLAASVMILACLVSYAEAKKKAEPVPAPVARPAPLTGIPVVGTVVQGSLRFAETLIYAPFELLGYRHY